MFLTGQNLNSVNLGVFLCFRGFKINRGTPALKTMSVLSVFQLNVTVQILQDLFR